MNHQPSFIAMKLGKYSIGIGDRFGCQGKAQLQALADAAAAGIAVTPVWNKSYREHAIIGTSPIDVRTEADAAVNALGWRGPYYVDADHIGLAKADLFVDSSDFFTIDVAEFIGCHAAEDDIAGFVDRHRDLVGTLMLPGSAGSFEITADAVRAAATKYLLAVQEAGRVYRRIEDRLGAGSFVTEVSMDEADNPQTPIELLLILAAVADEGIPAQTIAPRFPGRFNKGVDYVGNVAEFACEFETDIAVVAVARERFPLPSNLKLSVHSGSDKFSIYGPIRQTLIRSDAGLHLKTAGTTWLEELCALSQAGGEALEIAKVIYYRALERFAEMCAPYASVVDIKQERLPSAETVRQWSGSDYAAALKHDPSCDAYNPDFRQLLHVAYKVAAEMGGRFLRTLGEHEEMIAPNITKNILERHVKKIFPPAGG